MHLCRSVDLKRPSFVLYMRPIRTELLILKWHYNVVLTNYKLTYRGEMVIVKPLFIFKQ